MACDRQTAESYYQQGRQLREADEPVAAMEAFIAATRVRSQEYAIKGRSYSNMATMCRIGERHDLAFAIYAQSAEQFALAKDTLAYAYALNNMAWEQAVQGKKDSAMMFVDSALAIRPDSVVRNKVMESRAAAYLYAQEYDSLLGYTQALGPEPPVYFCMLRAQAYTFLDQCDSALCYAKRVLDQTDNPRYLDDVYYILTHCDTAAAAEQIRELASTRTDVQRGLERNRADWAEAMLLAQESLYPAKRSWPRWVIVLLVLSAFVLFGWTLYRTVIRKSKRNSSLEQQCRQLRHSAHLRDELQWSDYLLFRTVCNQRLMNIVAKLEQRGLSEREIRICVLVLIGFSYAEIADILYRAESGIGKDKYLIAKHLGVTAKDLKEALRTIACEPNE